jgi:predicted O-methyltransferase YrrM
VPTAYRVARRFAKIQKERVELHLVPKQPADAAEHLRRSLSQTDLRQLLSANERGTEWRELEPELARTIGAADLPGGVNPGDRRAIFSLLRSLAPQSVLEIGTHVGASTIHIIAALRLNRLRDPSQAPRLTTVDILDVNDPANGPWRELRLPHSPREMAARLGAASWTRFVAQPSLEYLTTSGERFDLIFLDGDHAAKTVYREVPAALRALNPGGVILLHDFFPHLRPLWSDGSVLPGPWLATRRLQKEGARFEVLPFGSLPWPTKLGSTVSSLGLMVGA